MRGAVIVSGLPGSGKSTLAAPLADQLGALYLSQDRVMDSLFDVLGTGERAWARTVSRAAMAAIFEIMGRSEFTVVDAWWPEDRSDLLQPWLTQLVQVRCVCPPSLARDRFVGRTRHVGHRDDQVPAEELDALAARSTYAGIALPCPTLEVDTTTAIDTQAVADWVRQALDPIGAER